jgi:hypothetical protein
MNSEEDGPIRVSEAVAWELEEIRRSGLTNMLDRPAVIRLCRSYGYGDAAEWVGRNPDLYARGIIRGIRSHSGTIYTRREPQPRPGGMDPEQYPDPDGGGCMEQEGREV